MYMDFDEYPPYSGAISETLKLILMPTFGAIMASLIKQSKVTC